MCKVMWIYVIIDKHLVASTLLLGFWTAESIPGFQENDYIALYASFGEYRVFSH